MSAFSRPLARREVVHLATTLRYLGSEGKVAVLVALAEQQRQALGDLEREQVRPASPGRGQV